MLKRDKSGDCISKRIHCMYARMEISMAHVSGVRWEMQ